MDILTPDFAAYELLDSGGSEKLERFGRYVLRRPEPQAVWGKSLGEAEWERLADGTFTRLSGAGGDERGRWWFRDGCMAQGWPIEYSRGGLHLRLRLVPTSFKHVGLFPEQAANWDYIYDRTARITARGTAAEVLNLFAYTGGASLAACAAGARVTHVDSVRQVVSWARGNMEASGLKDIRWVVEDALKYVRREVRRGRRYDGIILDPPAYGRGAAGEKWVLEENIREMLECCSALLDSRGFVVLNLYSMGLSPVVAHTALTQCFGAGEYEYGELCFADRAGKRLPLGTFCRMQR